MKRFKFFKRKSSSTVARERLKQLLMNDRMNLSADLAEKIHRDIIKSISKYLEIEEQGVNIKFEKNNESQETFIKVIIPVKSMKQQR